MTRRTATNTANSDAQPRTSRRSFLRTTAAASAAVGLAGCVSPSPDPDDYRVTFITESEWFESAEISDVARFFIGAGDLTLTTTLAPDRPRDPEWVIVTHAGEQVAFKETPTAATEIAVELPAKVVGEGVTHVAAVDDGSIGGSGTGTHVGGDVLERAEIAVYREDGPGGVVPR
jgi:hypothetical protein